MVDLELAVSILTLFSRFSLSSLGHSLLGFSVVHQCRWIDQLRLLSLGKICRHLESHIFRGLSDLQRFVGRFAVQKLLSVFCDPLLS